MSDHPPPASDNGLPELRSAVADLHTAITFIRDLRGNWSIPQPVTQLPVAASESWNFTTFEKYINQRFTDMAMNLRERYEAQQTGVTAALAAAEKAVNAALIAAEKAVDKAEGAQQLRNEAQNEFRKSLSDLSALMWTTKEGLSTVDSVRRESSTATENLDKKIATLATTRQDATEQLRKSVEGRLGILETAAANMQGRIWAVSAVWGLVVLAVSIGVRFLH